MFVPMFLLPSVLLILTLTDRGAAVRVQCSYGEGLICASDGYTYQNKCDFDLVKSIYVGLRVAHPGPCGRYGYITNPIIQVYNAFQEYGDNSKVLRKQSSKKVKSKLGELSRILLSQIINAQSQIGFNFQNNAVNTQGNQNQFQINYGA